MTRVGGLTSLTLPTLPKLGGLSRKRYKPPRPEYSVDIEGERRGQKRISIEELSQRGVDVLKERAPDLLKADRRSLFTKVTDVLDIPRNLVANAIASIAGMSKEKLREGTLQKTVYMSDVLEHLGVAKGPLRSIIGFVGDVAVDPLTYVSLGGGAGLKIAKHLPRAVGPAAGMIRTAAKTGKAAPELAKALNLRKGLPAVFGWLSKRYGAQRAATMLLGKQGGMLTRRIAREATKGAPGALALLTKYGEKARPLLRLPFASKGIGEVLPGARKARYKGVLESASEAGQRAHGILAAGKSRVASKTAAAASGISKANELKAALAVENAKVADLQKKYSQYLKAESSARAVKYPGTTTTKSLVETSKIRKARRDLDIATQIRDGVRERYKQAKAIEGIKGKFEVSKEAEGIMRGVIRKPLPDWKLSNLSVRNRVKALAETSKGAPRLTIYPAGKERFRTPLQLAKTDLAAALHGGKKAKALLTQADILKQQAANAANTIKRIETGPLAPGVLKQKQIAEMGKPLIRNQPGIAGSLTRLKQQVFGAPVTPQRQRIVGIQGQLGRGAVAAAPAKLAIEKQIVPIVKQYVAAGKGTEDEISQLLFRLAEAGPDLSGMKNLPLTDALRKSITKARQIGLADDPSVRKVLDDVWRMKEAAGAAKGVAGLEGYMPRLPTDEARQLLKKQKARVTDLPFRAERDRLLTFTSPTGEIDKFTSTSVGAKERIAALRAKGWKKTAEEAISTEQMNLMAPEMTRFGPDKEILKAKGAFKESLPEAAGSLASQKERAIGEKQFTDFLKEHAVRFPKGRPEAAKGYANLARLTPRSGDNPMYQLARRSGFTEGVGFPVQIANMVDDLTAVWDKPEMVESLLKSTDKLLGIWKGFQLYHPAYLIRNVFQNFFGGLMAGANPANVVGQMSDKRVRGLTTALAVGDPAVIRGMTKQIAGKDVPLETVYAFLKERNIVNAGRTAAETGVHGIAKKIGSVVYRLNNNVENNMKVATFMDFLNKGMTMNDSLMQTLMAMPDLTDLTLFEREGLARLFPWYRWMRRNGGLQLFTYLPQKPAYAAMLPRFKNFLEGFRGQDNVPEEIRPMWMNEQAGIQIGGTKESGRVWTAQTWFPFEEMYMLLGAPIQPEDSARRLVSSMRPGAKFLAEAATGTDIFRRTPQEPIGGIGGAIKKLPAALAGKSGTALDSLLALRPVRELTTRIPQMPSFGAGAERAVLGGALQPVDYAKGLTARYYELNKQQRDLRIAINRAAQVNDQALVESLTRQWIAVIKQMHDFKFPLPRHLEQSLQAAGVPRSGPP